MKKCENMLNSYERSDEGIKPIIRDIFERCHKRFGRKPIHHKQKEPGYQISEKRVCRLMNELGLEVEKPKHLADHMQPLPRQCLKNLLHQDFSQDRPNKVWVSDITYIKVREQYYFICVILDLFSRTAISYGISDRIDSTLVMRTFDAASVKRQKPSGLMIHSDQGIQHTSNVFREKQVNLLRKHKRTTNKV